MGPSSAKQAHRYCRRFPSQQARRKVKLPCDHFQATKEEYSETSEGLSNLHTRIQRERRITCSTVWWLGMLGGYGEVCSATLDRVGVAIALGSRHGERAGGDKFVQQDALPILGNVA